MKLILPNKKYLNQYIDAFNEYKQHGVFTYKFYDASKMDIFKYMDNLRKGINLKPGYVPATTYWLVDNDEFIGEIGIRHRLTDRLLKYAGNIGYGIRYSKFGKGYGTKMLHLALKKAKKLGLKKVLITCDKDNIASAKVIENNGGMLENVITNKIDGKTIKTKRYWIDLKNFKI